MALGELTNNDSPEYCVNTNQNVCGFYHEYGGLCTDSDTFDSDTFTIRPYSNQICNMADTLLGGSTSTQQSYSWESRCFMLNAAPKCFQTTCFSNYIEIDVIGNTITCQATDTSVTTPYGTLDCPDFDILCGKSTCESWCYTQGMCLKG